MNIIQDFKTLPILLKDRQSMSNIGLYFLYQLPEYGVSVCVYGLVQTLTPQPLSTLFTMHDNDSDDGMVELHDYGRAPDHDANSQPMTPKLSRFWCC